MLTLKEVARRMRVTEETARQWFHSGEIKGAKVGGVIRVFESSLPSEEREAEKKEKRK